MSNNLIHDSSKKYFTQLPNMVDDLTLTVYAFRLYVHFKRVAGDNGACWQATETLARSCGISRSMVSKAKGELNRFGLISVEKRRGPHGWYDWITITDIWKRNMDFFSEAGENCQNTP